MSIQDVDAAIGRGKALLHAALLQRLLHAAAEFQGLDAELVAFIDAVDDAEAAAPFFDPTLYAKNLRSGDPLGTMKTLATAARALGAALPRACRECGCTAEQACEGGCSWIAPGLCSSCRPER